MLTHAKYFVCARMSVCVSARARVRRARVRSKLPVYTGLVYDTGIDLPLVSSNRDHENTLTGSACTATAASTTNYMSGEREVM